MAADEHSTRRNHRMEPWTSWNTAIVPIVAVVVFAGGGNYIYHEQHKKTVEISIGGTGVKIRALSTW